MIPPERLSGWQHALPFWVPFALAPLAWISALFGGWWVLALPLATWVAFSVLDGFVGLDLENADPDTPREDLKLYDTLLLCWPAVQFVTLFGTIWIVAGSTHLTGFEKFAVFFGVGILTGTVGINYSHELMHRKGRRERWLADLLLAMVLYSHFRSEHLLVHHRYIGTPRDPVTARYNEGFHRYYPRVLIGCLKSALRAEKEKLARKDLPWADPSNPFFHYWALQLAMILLALLLGGLGGLVLFLVQAGVAIWQLELVNYVEHYGLTRKHLGEGRYEHVQPRHSWNAAHLPSNRLLINLQRHSDHHYKPDRPFPLLQTYTMADAPQLPHGYPVMTVAAMIPPLWRRIMNPRVRRWREMYYPEITDWQPYNKASLPMPR